MPESGRARGDGPAEGLWQFLASRWSNWLLLFVPASLAAWWLHVPALWLFIGTGLAIMPLAALIGSATDHLARRLGPGTGGLVSATFGNAAELIIALTALQAGLFRVVKASITGSIIANVLLVLGTSMFAGGLGRTKQTFSRTRAGASAAMLFLAVVALIMPALFDLAVFGKLHDPSVAIEDISLWVAVVLVCTYLAGLVFQLKTHRDILTASSEEPEPPGLGAGAAAGVLLVATALMAVEADLLVSSISAATAALGMTEFFVGVVIVALLGNVAEHYTALTMAMRNRMDLAVTIATASSTQIALFVAPVLIFASFIIGRPMSLVFNPFEIAGIGLAVIILAIAALDGESNWFEGVQLVAVYLILAIVFYFVPDG